MRVAIIGMGGIGSHLAAWVAQLLAYTESEHTLTLVDGDAYEPKNRTRQSFERVGNKAAEQTRILTPRFPEVRIDTVAAYLTPENTELVILEDEIVLVCVDNHKTRKLVSDAACKLANVSVISGGNEMTTGNLYVFLRRDGVNLTPALDQGHPEIAEPEDRAPFEMGCEELAASGTPQLLCTNVNVAACMLNALYRLITDPGGFVTGAMGNGAMAMSTAYTEVHVDIIVNRAMSINRQPKPMKGDRGHGDEERKEERNQAHPRRAREREGDLPAARGADAARGEDGR